MRFLQYQQKKKLAPRRTLQSVLVSEENEQLNSTSDLPGMTPDLRQGLNPGQIQGLRNS